MITHERIKKRRKELGLSAEQVAEALKVSRATVYRYESAEIEKVPIDILIPLAKVLQTTPGYLAGWDLYVDPDDAEFIKDFLKSDVNKVQDLPQNLIGFNLLLNEIGCDLRCIEQQYYLSDDYGAYIVPKNDIDELVSATKKFIQFSVHELRQKHSSLPGPLKPLKNTKDESE